MWLNHLINGASNLLWLALEQILKILLLQKEIDMHSRGSADLAALHVNLDKQAKKFGHNVDNLIKKVDAEYPDLHISKYEAILVKLQEYFYRRYVVHSGSSVSLSMIDGVDELYFLLRSKIHSDVGLGTIDEIYIQKKHQWCHPLPTFSSAYFQNRYFKPRKHREINLLRPDGRIYKESGE